MEDSLLKADIFFLISTVAVVVIAVCLVWVLFYLIKILRNVQSVSEDVKREVHAIAEDAKGVHNTVHSGIRRLLLMIAKAKRFFGGSRKKPNRRYDKSIKDLSGEPRVELQENMKGFFGDEEAKRPRRASDTSKP